MATKVIGTINIGLLFGLLQFVSTFAITIAYMRWADREFDPTADALRERIEGDLDGRGERSLHGRGEGSPDGRGKGRLDGRLEGRDLR
jgi:hypothetical protein